MSDLTVFWNATEHGKPKDDRLVRTISPGGMEQTLYYSGGLWFTDETQSMYVYYEPIFWREL